MSIRAPLPSHGPTSPDILSVDEESGYWSLDVSQYQSFLAVVTGVDVTDGLTVRRATLIRARLEGFIEQAQMNDIWVESLFDAYPDVGTRDELLALARFFRQYNGDAADSS